MIWQEAVFAAGSLLFTITLIPVLRSRVAKVPLSTSVLTAAILSAYAVAFWTLGLTYSAVTTTTTAAAWWAIARWRH